MSIWQSEKEDVVLAAGRMVELGLTTGSSGNVSLKLASPDRDLFAITPTGKPYSELQAEEVPVVDFDVEPVEGDLAPSSESLMHVAIYKARADVGAIVHTHAVYTTVAAVTGMEVPPLVDEMAVHIGGAVQVSDYAFPGTEELANNVSSTLGPRNAALIRNHGAVCVGRDLQEALDNAALLERLAQVFIYSSLLGRPNPLPPDVVDAEKALFEMRRNAVVNKEK